MSAKPLQDLPDKETANRQGEAPKMNESRRDAMNDVQDMQGAASSAPTEHTRREGRGGVPVLVAFVEWLRAILGLLAQMGGSWGRRKARAARPWHLKIGRKERAAPLSDSEVNRLLQRHRDLKDVEKIAGFAAQFRVPESDFFGDPQQVERLIRHFLTENPPWLHVGRVLSGGEQGSEAQSPEVVWREQEVREMQDVTLFVPDISWRDLPLASLTLRPARNLREVWQARLLDQVLPPEVLVDRCNRGEVMIPVRNQTKQRLEFLAEERRMELTVRKPVPIPIETEGGSGRGGQLLYFLLDYSASMRGKNATLAMAVIAAVLRANMGQRDTRYLFRRYAACEELWPRAVEVPLQARTVAEKDALLDTILATNFNGSATNVNDALNIAAADIETLRKEAQLDAQMLLVTDGQAEILESTRLRLQKAGVRVHAVMVTPDRHPGLEGLSESFTALDIRPDLTPNPSGDPTVSPAAPRRRAYHI